MKFPSQLTQQATKQGGTGPHSFDPQAYREFIARKCEFSADHGFQVPLDSMHPWLKPHQKAIVQWAVAGGRRAIFTAFGLGKSGMQLETLRLILRQTTEAQRHGEDSVKPVRGLIVCPLGVRQEFKRDAQKLGIPVKFIRRIEECEQDSAAAPSVESVPLTAIGSGRPEAHVGAGLGEVPAGKPGGSRVNIFLTNYETVRDGKLDPAQFTATSLDEASVLRSFGGTKTFREFMRLFEAVPYRFVATATPSPNEYIELLAYAAYLGIMDVSQAKTRFFKRDSTKADKLTIHPHKVREFWLWVATWAIFLDRPSDLGFSDEGYDLPPIDVIRHEVEMQSGRVATLSRDGQAQMFRDASLGVSEAAREKRETLDARIEVMTKILAAEPAEHFILWHDLEAERAAIEQAVPTSVSVYGSQDLDEREQAVIDFSDGKMQYLAAKPVIAGSGCNFQRHCANAIFLGIGFKFNDFIQAVHRIHRFLQGRPVRIHLIYSESERRIYQILMDKWDRHKEMMEQMRGIIREYGLSQTGILGELQRSIGVDREEVKGPGSDWRLVHADAVEECARMAGGEENSADLILTSIPFSTQYEYTPSYNDFGHSESNAQFFEQMDFMTPNLLRVLRPGRIAAVHVKDRIVPGGINRLGFQTVYPFHCDCIRHFTRHGFAYLGMKTIVTDVVRENNQTYRLGWTEQCKDGTKMGIGMPEYLLLFRKPPSDSSRSYADVPVVKGKPLCDDHGEPRPFNSRSNWKQPVVGTGYSRGRWQMDAHGFARSSGDRLLSTEELQNLPHDQIYKAWRDRSTARVYDFEGHVAVAEDLDHMQRLPATFMLLPPHSWHPDVWADIARMRTLNMIQQRKGKEMHLCPLQFDICDRVIRQFTMEGETILDPFCGIGTVPYRALLLKRKAVGIELSPSYFVDAVSYCHAAEQKVSLPSLFEVLAAGEKSEREEEYSVEESD
jgi:hypothetical protein